MTDWKPGDVALIEVGCHANRRMAQRVDGDVAGWGYVTREGNVEVILDTAGIVTPLRRLAVIDPENREDVERLAKAYRDSFGKDTPPSTFFVDNLQQALREYANPTPPKPPEPKGLGAVVEDADGDKWVLIELASGAALWRRRSGSWLKYADINAVRVLSEGWSK